MERLVVPFTICALTQECSHCKSDRWQMSCVGSVIRTSSDWSNPMPYRVWYLAVIACPANNRYCQTLHLQLLVFPAHQPKYMDTDAADCLLAPRPNGTYFLNLQSTTTIVHCASPTAWYWPLVTHTPSGQQQNGQLPSESWKSISMQGWSSVEIWVGPVFRINAPSHRWLDIPSAILS